MSKIVLRSLSILLGSFFIFLGVLKITPRISRDLHKDLRTEYAKYAKVFPLAKLLDFKLPSKWYRRVVGGLEIVAGFLMMAPVPGSTDNPWRARWLKNGANVLLLGLKVLNVYSHWAINDEFERTAPSLVFFLLLSCRLVVDWQLARNATGNPAGNDSVKAPNDEDRFNQADTDSGLSDNQEPYIKTRSKRNISMEQKKDQ